MIEYLYIILALAWDHLEMILKLNVINKIQFNSIQLYSIQFNSIQFNSIQFNSI